MFARAMPFKKRMLWCLAGLFCFGCGLITAPLSLPEAFSHNATLGLEGSIVDDTGEGVDQVIIDVDRTYYLWHADGSYNEYDKWMVASDRNIRIPTTRANTLVYTFRKPGYSEEKITLDTEGFKGSNSLGAPGYRFPIGDKVKVILHKAGDSQMLIDWARREIDFTDPTQERYIDLNEARAVAALTVTPGQPMPQNSLHAVIERQPLKTTGPDRRIDPLELNMPANMVFRISGDNNGFAPFTPIAGTDPFDQMTDAPESGYAPEWTLTSQRLRKMRNAESQLVIDRNEYFYFKAGGKFGKCLITWTNANDASSPLKLRFVIALQRNGSRNLNTNVTGSASR